jgi:hypothetical protein
MMRIVFAAAYLTLLGGMVSANELSQTDVFLSCTFSEGRKAVTVDVTGNVISYRFGVPGEMPELIMERDVSQVVYTPWNGIGRNIWEQVDFINDDYTYQVWGNRAKIMDAEDPLIEVSGGIGVLKEGELLANLSCDPGSVVFPWIDILAQ